MVDGPALLLAEVERLEHLLRGRGPGWYAARPRHDRTRAAVLRDLVAALARLGVEAGTGQPAEAAPPLLGDHALADQLRLLGHELTASPDGGRAARPALIAVRAAREQL